VSTAVRTAPANRLPDGVRSMWLCDALLRAAIFAGIALAIAAAVGALMPWLPLAIAAAGLAYAIVVPRKAYQRWRWELHEEELDLLHGVWSVTRTIVPITRIQHVSVQRTGWTDIFGLVRLHVHTAAGRTTIPGLERAQADDARDRILARLRTPDDL
jgi:membrane protein YdbS with pleckstrin-like domain